MNINYNLTPSEASDIIKLYSQGMSAQEIKDELKLPHTVRTIQRKVKAAGIVRTVGDSFRNAVARGRVKWAFKENKKHRKWLNPFLRSKILKRDNYKCKDCGATSETSILEIHHINNIPDDHREENLQVLCHDCNFGKSRD